MHLKQPFNCGCFLFVYNVETEELLLITGHFCNLLIACIILHSLVSQISQAVSQVYSFFGNGYVIWGYTQYESMEKRHLLTIMCEACFVGKQPIYTHRYGLVSSHMGDKCVLTSWLKSVQVEEEDGPWQFSNIHWELHHTNDKVQTPPNI